MNDSSARLPDERLSVRQAAAYLGLSLPGIKYHIYNSKLLVPDGKFEGRLYFTRPTLDAFLKQPGYYPRHSKTITESTKEEKPC
jgi:hypothetical protein